jgi:uncharacterized protein YbgA (DUF1722 family)/uncharacterized protein YbbK (DUF523 family)
MADVRPRVLFSRCLGFAACRYNGQAIHDASVDRLLPFVDAVTICPEMEIGLGVPRSPVRLVASSEGPRLLQPETGLDVTQRMAALARDFLAQLGPCDGAVLKAGSPSCGLRDVRLYAGSEKGSSHTKTLGMFGGAVLAASTPWATEDEGRLRNYDLRQHFLTRLFALARLRAVASAERMAALVAFHAEHKLLLMAYHQTRMRALGRLVANAERRPVREIAEDYTVGFAHALARPPRRTSAINVLQHAFGYVSDRLTSREKSFFLETLEGYRAGRLPLAVASGLMRALIVRFDVAYLADQVFFEPFPEGLVEVLDSGKGRDLR